MAARGLDFDGATFPALVGAVREARVNKAILELGGLGKKLGAK